MADDARHNTVSVLETGKESRLDCFKVCDGCDAPYHLHSRSQRAGGVAPCALYAGLTDRGKENAMHRCCLLGLSSWNEAAIAAPDGNWHIKPPGMPRCLRQNHIPGRPVVNSSPYTGFQETIPTADGNFVMQPTNSLTMPPACRRTAHGMDEHSTTELDVLADF